jgi:hypothetical protein
VAAAPRPNLKPPSFDDQELEIGPQHKVGAARSRGPHLGIRFFGKSQFRGIGNPVRAGLPIESDSVAMREREKASAGETPRRQRR